MTYVVGLGVLVTLYLALGRCFVAAVLNRWAVALRTVSSARRDQRLAQWVGLPVLGYVLAMVCNMGTGMVFDHHVMRGMDVLVCGVAALLVVGSVVAVLPPARDPWRLVGSWGALRAEVEEQLASGRLPRRAWLAGARGKWREFMTAEGHAQQLADRARALLPDIPGPGGPGPRSGLGVLRDVSNRRVPVPWRSVARWTLRDRWTMATLVSAVAAVALAAALPGPPPRAPAAQAPWMVLIWTLVVVLATVTGARAQLIYYARLHLEWEAAASSVDTALTRWERAAHRERWQRQLGASRRAARTESQARCTCSCGASSTSTSTSASCVRTARSGGSAVTAMMGPAPRACRWLLHKATRITAGR